MKLRADPWVLVGLLLALLMSAYNTFMEWRRTGERVPPSAVPVPGIEEQSGDSLWRNPFPEDRTSP